MFPDLEVQELSLDEALERFKEHLQMNYRGETQKLYVIDVRQFLNYIGRHSISRLNDIQLEQIKAFLDQLSEKNYSSFALYRKAAAVRSFFGYLTSAGYLEHDPSASLLLPERDERLPRVFTTAERRKMLAVCADNPRDAAIVELLFETGIRLTELEKLTLTDVLLPHPVMHSVHMGSLFIQGYGKKQRTLPLSYDAIRTLNRWLSARPKAESPALFVNRFGQLLNKRSIQNIVATTLRDAGISNASVHTFRHTFAVQQIIQGKSLTEVQWLLGHENTQYTKLYEIVAIKILEEDLG
jgi:site-specific recombinase XerD